MFALLRTYRFLAVALTAVLFFSGGLPLIQHLCAMNRAEAKTHRACCCHARHQPAAEAAVRHAEAAPAPCHEATPPPRPVALELHDGCCALTTATPDRPGGILHADHTLLQLLTPVLAWVVVTTPPQEALLSLPVALASPPPPSPPLHILNAALLI